MSKKFSPMRFTAATEEAAVEGAMQLVGATRDEISYDFISQNAKGVTIRIRPFEEDASAPEPELAAEVDEIEADEIEAEAPLHLDSMNDFDDADDAATADETDDSETDDEDEANGSPDDELDFDADLELADDEYDSENDDSDSDDSDDDDSDDDDSDDDDSDGDDSDGDDSDGDDSDGDDSDGDEISEDDEDLDEEADGENLDEEDSKPAQEVEPRVEIDAEILERTLTLARAILDKMGLEAQVSSGRATSVDIVPLVIEGEDVGILIGKHGATLQSFQYLMNLTLNNHSEGDVRVAVDAGNYRARRQESLEAVARGTASRVRRENRPIKMEPMPSNERRIVHDFLKTEIGVSTQSEGREPHRCIVIAPAESGYRGSADESNRGRRGMGGYGRGGRNRR